MLNIKLKFLDSFISKLYLTKFCQECRTIQRASDNL